MIAAVGIDVPKAALESFCRRNHIRALAFLSPTAETKIGYDSDVDALVDFEEGHVPDYFGLFRMEEELSQVLQGKKVEMNTLNAFAPSRQQQIMQQSVVQYGRF